jgi:hypothetical protein
MEHSHETVDSLSLLLIIRNSFFWTPAIGLYHLTLWVPGSPFSPVILWAAPFCPRRRVGGCELAMSSSRSRGQRDHGALGRAGSEGGVAPKDGRWGGGGGDDGAERGASSGVAGDDEAGTASLADAVADGPGGGLADEEGRGQGGDEFETHDGSVRLC